MVGRKLWALARNHQVLCITHLPQLAGFGDQHFKVEKVIAGDRTLTHVRPLTEADRVAELAQMLGGAGEKTRATAEELLLLVHARSDPAATATMAIFATKFISMPHNPTVPRHGAPPRGWSPPGPGGVPRPETPQGGRARGRSQ